MGIVRLDQKQKRVKVGEFEISNEFVFEYINSLTSASTRSRRIGC